MINDTIDFGQSVPIKFTLETVQTTPRHWHQHIEVIYVLSGKLTVTIKEQLYHLGEDGMILINAYDIHSLSANDCRIAVFEISMNRFESPLIPAMTLRFDCNTATCVNPEAFLPLKRLLALLIKSSTTENHYKEILHISYAYSLLYQLIEGFLTESADTMSNNPTSLNRFEDILKFLNQHYMEEITLSSLSADFYLTVPYLSRIFKKHVGVGYTDYMNALRLSHAINDITNLNWSIEYVAEKNGFANVRTFVGLFKKKYGILPSHYRKELAMKPSPTTVQKPGFVEKSLGFTQRSHLGRLAQYLDIPDSPTVHRPTALKTEEILPVSVSQKGFPLKHTFRNTTSIGKAKHILYGENQQMLIQLQKEIGFNYIKFHGLLDDDMMVYSEDEHGNPELNFTYIDMVIDFLLSISLRPLMQLSFMPKQLAAHPERTMFFTPSHISLPKDYSKWCQLIQALVRHLENRYTSKEVEKWPFYLWNEPDSPTSMFGFEPTTDYHYFYRCTYETVKKCNPNIIFGAPSVLNLTAEDGLWIDDFLRYCTKHNCKPEFLNYHFYPVALENGLDKDLQREPHLALLESEDAFNDNIHKVLSNIKKYSWDIDKVYVTEWNSSISHRDLLNDTAFKAPYIIKNILENYDRLESFGYWVMSDFIEEVKTSGHLFHGGMGLFTYNGIKKSPFHAFVMLSKLGDTMIGRGKGYFITKKKHTYQIILYNYQHFSSLYASGELFDMTFTKRYTPFPDAGMKKFIIPLADLPMDHYVLTETILNRHNGSAFDKWIDLGALPLDTQDEVDYIKAVSIPQLKKRLLEVENGCLTISCELEPHEVRLIQIQPKVGLG